MSNQDSSSSSGDQSDSTDFTGIGAQFDDEIHSFVMNGQDTILEIHNEPEALYGTTGGALDAMQNGTAPWSPEGASNKSSNS